MKHPKYTEAWTLAAVNEHRRLFQGCGRNEDGMQCVVGTNECHWIKRNQVLNDKIATYNRSVADIKPEKAEPKQVRFTKGGNILNYAEETSTETASIETAKPIINRTLSTRGEKFMAIDTGNFYTQNDLEDFQYIRFVMDQIPQEIIDEYNLEAIVHTDCYLKSCMCFRRQDI